MSSSQGPPYSPRNQGLGGSPAVIPDVPIAAVFLVLYLIFGIIHIKIFKSNKSRGHKFIFNGAVLGLCKIRIVTMSLRMAWACHPRNISLAIAANVFVYVGTIILFMINWFFVQRIIRAQHAHLGWSTPYRIFHRAGLGLLVTTLIMLVIASIWQSFTTDAKKLHVFRALQLTGQTYQAIFVFAPAVLVFISLLLPRHEIEKFGAGRLRINIIILLLAVTVLSTGQIFRCVIAWIPQTPLRDSVGRPTVAPWYLHKVCFYVFNFVTELIVIVLFAVVRVDLRFHVPNGSRISGDYSGRNSRVTLNNIPSEKSLAAAAPQMPMSQLNDSSETLHQYETSVFEDSNTLADSLRYGSSTLEVDAKTGNWKVKRMSSGSTSSHVSIHSSSPSRSSLHERNVTFADDVPPVPEIPSAWPLPDCQPAHNSMPIMEHSNPPTRRGTPKRTFELADHHLNNVNMGDAITDALSMLEQNSEHSKRKVRAKEEKLPITIEKSPKTPPPEYNDVVRMTVGKGAPLVTKDKHVQSSKNPLAPRDRSTFPPKSALKASRNHSNANSTSSNTPTIPEAPELPPQPLPIATTKMPNARRSSSLELITLSQRPSSDARRILDMSLQGDKAGDVERPESAKDMSHEKSEGSGHTSVARAPSSAYSGPAGITRAYSSAYSDGTTSSDAREAVTAEDEFSRFSYEAAPLTPLSEADIMRADRRFD